MLITSSPVEGGEVDPGEPVDDLGQYEDGAEQDDAESDEAVGVEIKESGEAVREILS